MPQMGWTRGHSQWVEVSLGPGIFCPPTHLGDKECGLGWSRQEAQCPALPWAAWEMRSLWLLLAQPTSLSGELRSSWGSRVTEASDLCSGVLLLSSAFLESSSP